MRIEVPHMYSTLREAFANVVKVNKSVCKSEYWTPYHELTKVTLEDAVYTGDPHDTMATDTGILVGWQQGYGKFIYEPRGSGESVPTHNRGNKDTNGDKENT